MSVTNGLNVPKSRLGTIVDSGASLHFCPKRLKFETFEPIASALIRTADGRTFNGRGRGNVWISLPNGSTHTDVILRDTIYAPKMVFTLVSVSCLNNANGDVQFHGGMCTTSSPDGWVIGKVPHADRLYHLSVTKEDKPTAQYANVALRKLTMYEAHHTLGHIHYAAVKHAMKSRMVIGLDVDLETEEKFCEACAKAKPHRKPFPNEASN
jgi:hypothetical protein